MTDASIILICGLGSALAWGISDYLAALSAKKVGPTLASAVMNVLSALLFGLVFLIFFRNQALNNVAGILYAITAGITLSLGSFAFFRGLEKGPVSIVSPLSSLYPLITTLLAIVVFNATLSLVQVIGMALIMIGIFGSSGLLNTKKAERKVTTGPKFGLLTALFWGIGYALLTQAINRLGWQTASMIEFLLIGITFITLASFLKNNEVISYETVRQAVKNKFIIGASIIQLIGVLALSYGLSKEIHSGAIVVALSACYPILTVFLALKNMKEQVVLTPLLCAFIGIIGVITLALG